MHAKCQSAQRAVCNGLALGGVTSCATGATFCGQNARARSRPVRLEQGNTVLTHSFLQSGDALRQLVEFALRQSDVEVLPFPSHRPGVVLVAPQVRRWDQPCALPLQAPNNAQTPELVRPEARKARELIVRYRRHLKLGPILARAE